MENDPGYYRDKAEQCRRMARAIYNQTLEDDLLKSAEEFEAKAVAAEAMLASALAARREEKGIPA